VTITRDVILADAGKAHAGRDAQRIRAYVDTILRQANPVQRRLILDPAKRIVALTPRRVGKTTAVRGRLVRRSLMQRGANCLYIGMTRQSAEELLWNPLKELNDELALGARFNNSALRMVIPSLGSEITLNGADNQADIDKYRGQKFDEVWIDESKSFKPKLLDELLKQVIGPALMDRRGTLGMIGTPGHILSGPFYEATRSGSAISKPWNEIGPADRNFWSLHSWTLRDNTALPHLWDEALGIKEREGWTDENPIWRREYLGQWVADDADRVYKFREYTDDGLPWNVWEPEATDANPFGLPGDHWWRFVYGVDLGSKDPFALQVLAYSDTCPTLYHVYEYSQKGLTVTQVGELLTDLISKTGYPEAIVADLAGNGGMIIAELNERFGLSVEAAEKKNKPDSIELTNSDLIDGRLKLLKGSLITQQMMDLQWDETGMKENKAQRNDCCDAFIYARRRALHHFYQADAPAKKPQAAQVDDEFDRLERERVARKSLGFMSLPDEPI
jgi:hypothetical protein